MDPSNPRVSTQRAINAGERMLLQRWRSRQRALEVGQHGRESWEAHHCNGLPEWETLGRIALGGVEVESERGVRADRSGSGAEGRSSGAWCRSWRGGRLSGRWWRRRERARSEPVDITASEDAGPGHGFGGGRGGRGGAADTHEPHSPTGRLLQLFGHFQIRQQRQVVDGRQQLPRVALAPAQLSLSCRPVYT